MIKADIKELSLKGKKPILANVEFEIKKNSVFTIVGANGSGKTTLIKSLTGLLNPRFYSVTGRVMFNGKDILALDNESLLQLRRDKIKYVFQDAVNSFDHLKKFEYYFSRLAKDKEEIDPVLEYFLLPKHSDLLNRYPYEVSGGMAQRINFILALLAHPEIIILDEPTSGIDLAISNLFLLKLRGFVSTNNKQGNGQDHAILLVTHDLDFARKVSDEVAFLFGGRLSRFYPAEEFFNMDKNKLSELLPLADGQSGAKQNWFLDSYKQLSL